MKKYLEEKLLNRLDYSKETTDEEVLSQIDDLFLLEEAIRLYPVDIRHLPSLPGAIKPRRQSFICRFAPVGFSAEGHSRSCAGTWN